MLNDILEISGNAHHRGRRAQQKLWCAVIRIPWETAIPLLGWDVVTVGVAVSACNRMTLKIMTSVLDFSDFALCK